MRRGFTLIEIILATGLLSALFMVGLQSETIVQSVLSGRGNRQVQSVLEISAQRARSGVNGGNWGVYFDYDDGTRVATRAIIFSGASYALRDTAQDAEFPLGNAVLFTDVSLGGASPSLGDDHEIVFTFLTGKTSQYGTVTIDSYSSSTQIDISETGIAVRH